MSSNNSNQSSQNSSPAQSPPSSPIVQQPPKVEHPKVFKKKKVQKKVKKEEEEVKKTKTTAMDAIGATVEEYNKYTKEIDFEDFGPRGLEVCRAYNEDQTPTGERTERCSFQIKLKLSKCGLKQIQHYVRPVGGGKYTDQSIKAGLNKYFFDKWNSLLAHEYFNRGLSDYFLDTDFFEEEFCDGYLCSEEGRKIMDEEQDKHNKKKKTKQVAKTKETQATDAKAFLMAMTPEERQAFLSGM